MMPYLTIGSVTIPTFFIVISLSLSFVIIYLEQRLDNFSGDRRIAYDAVILLMITGIIGGRLMHIFYEEWPYYQKYPIQTLYFWQGGFVFWGGFLFAVFCGFIYSRIKKADFFLYGDFFAPLLSIGHSFGRLGCFFAGCCFGIKCELPWSIEGRHPTALYLAIGELLIFAYLLFFEKKIRSLNRPELKGSVLVKWILLHSLLRYFVEFFRDDFRGAFFDMPLVGSLSVSQLISFVLILFCFGFFIMKSRHRKK